MSIGLNAKLLRNMVQTYITTTTIIKGVPAFSLAFLLLTFHMSDHLGPALLGDEKLSPQGRGEDSHSHFTATLTPALQNGHGKTGCADRFGLKRQRESTVDRKESSSTRNYMNKLMHPLAF